MGPGVEAMRQEWIIKHGECVAPYADALWISSRCLQWTSPKRLGNVSIVVSRQLPYTQIKCQLVQKQGHTIQCSIFRTFDSMTAAPFLC